MSKRTNPKPFVCPACGKRFKTLGVLTAEWLCSLGRHIRWEHGNGDGCWCGPTGDICKHIASVGDLDLHYTDFLMGVKETA